MGLPGVVLQEVLSGIRNERQFADLERLLLASFTVVNADAEDYVEAARLTNRCQAKGLSPSGPDCLIAVTAIAGNHELFAIDKDFRDLAKQAPLRLFKRKGAGLSP